MANSRLILSIAVALILSIFLGCKKGSDPEKEAEALPADIITTISGKSCKVTRIYNETESEIYEYNSEDKLTKISQYYGKQLISSISLTYSGNIISGKIMYLGELYQTLSYTLANGRIIKGSSTMYLEDDTYRAKDEVSMTLKHNAEGFVTQLVENHKLTSNRPGSQVDYVNNIKDYSYQNGNLTQVICTSNLPSEEYVMKYAHYLDKPNVLTVNSDLDYLFTKPDKNLVKQVEVTFDGDLYFSYRQDYQFDAEGLIKKIRFVELDQDGNSYDDQAGESFIDYQCK